MGVKHSRFTDEGIFEILKEQENSCYKYAVKFRRMGASDGRKLKFWKMRTNLSVGARFRRSEIGDNVARSRE